MEIKTKIRPVSTIWNNFAYGLFVKYKWYIPWKEVAESPVLDIILNEEKKIIEDFKRI